MSPEERRRFEADVLRRISALMVRMSHRGGSQAGIEALRNNAGWIADYAEQIEAGRDHLPGLDGKRIPEDGAPC